MSYKKEDLIAYRLEKAEDAMEEAKTLAKIEHWDTVCSRLYYVCFYAITAYLAQQEVQAITHKGIKSAFHRELIKSGVMSKKLGRLYNDLFNKRQEADYKDFSSFDKTEVVPLIKDTQLFLKKVKQLLK